MHKQVIFLLALFATVPAWTQVQPAATGDAAPIEDENRMTTPPLESGMLYPTAASSEERSNSVTASVTANAAYIDNVLPASTATPISDYTISILPAVSFDRTTPRQKETFSYNPSFTFYRVTSSLNALAQSATGSFEGRLSPHLTVDLTDNFVKTSNVFDTPYPFTAGGLNGSTQTPVQAIIAPFAEQLSNSANVDLTYQFSSQAMVGAGGLFSTFRYPNPAQSPGLYDSDGTGASAFYNRRLTRAQSIGVMYEYNDTLSYLKTSRAESQINGAFPFYTFASSAHKFSLSVSAGAQHLEILQRPSTVVVSWSPAVVLSFGWQGIRGYGSASYLHTVVSGQGLQGAFSSDNMNVSGGWKITRTWTGSASFSYQTTNAVTSLPGLNYQGGNGITGAVSIQKTIGERISVACGYDRLHEQYNGLAIITADPDSDRAFATVTYTLRKPLGR